MESKSGNDVELGNYGVQGRKKTEVHPKRDRGRRREPSDVQLWNV